ncbi:Atp18 subunit J of the mitochondrial F1F0 ATP synthase [Malassezia pachydermatis]|uniref:Atp18-subunit i j of the mitochondrial f1f0-atp synthase n=1 Tax=Malassezia pachydermatis TaxID=77020 RepID=A0A0M9VPS1_9BASI|nr:atp18-subunit i j of the mitochondrial f1f0-atp synthase [Malassezia pachydermatis]KOS14723.1 atp18-subunit i j of the mitochondrial f1f0-atp synthase [Malassezia pachydermatis]
MAFFGFRAYPTPILKPLWPFMASAGIVYYVVSKLQYSGVRSAEYAKDPKNPYATQIAKEASHH